MIGPYDDVLPYFRRSEANPERANSRFHGQDGSLHVAKAKGKNPLYQDFLAAGHGAGYPANDDFNGAIQEGLGFYDFNTQDAASRQQRQQRFCVQQCRATT